MNQAYFSNIRKEIIATIKSAKEEVLVAMAWFTSDELLDELINCISRRVKVSLVLLDDAINWMPYAPDFNKFIDAGGKFFVASTSIGFMHHKFCVVDKKMVVTGSYNWTYYAENRNLENIVISDDARLCVEYRKEFDNLVNSLSLCTKAKKLDLKDISDYNYVNIDEINNEIETISTIRNLSTITQIVKPQIVVQIVDRQRKAYSRLNIGMFVDKEWVGFVNIGDELPKTNNNPIPFYLKPDECSKAEWVILKADEQDEQDEQTIILSRTLSEIAHNAKVNSEIKVTISLNQEGSIHCEIHSVESGKSLIATQIVPSAVRYE